MNLNYSIYHCDNFTGIILSQISLPLILFFVKLQGKDVKKTEVTKEISGIYRLHTVPHNMNDCNGVVCFLEESLTC